MNVNEMFPSKYIRGSDLKEPTLVTITGVKAERIYKPGQGQVDGYILYCEKSSKGIVLTRPLALGIAAALNEMDTDKWPGRQVILYPQPMTVAGRDTVAIRARPAK